MGSRIFGILVTYKRPSELQEALTRLARQDRCLDRLIIVDNAPTEFARTLARAYAEDNIVDYVGAPENLGPAGGIALGMRMIMNDAHDQDWVVTLDDDDPLWASSALAAIHESAEQWLSRDPTTGCVGTGGTVLNLRTGRASVISDQQLAMGVQPDSIGGGRFPCYLAAAIRSVGEFREDLFFGFEEQEYGLRLKAKGFSMHIDPLLRAERSRADETRPTTNLGIRLSTVSWRRYYAIRNMVFVLRLYGATRAARRVSVIALGKPVVNFPLSPSLSVRHLSLAARACRDGWTNRMGRRVQPT